MKKKYAWPAAILALTLSTGADAVPISVKFTVVDSFVKTNVFVFGLAYNTITNTIWYSNDASGTVLKEINQNAPGGPDTGAITPTPAGGARAFDSIRGQFVTAGAGQPVPQDIFFNDPFTGGNQQKISVSASVTPRAFVIDGLDVDHGEIWYSPDPIGPGQGGDVFRLDMTGTLTGPAPNPVLVASGPDLSGIDIGFSGVERIDVGPDSLLIANRSRTLHAGGFSTGDLCAFTLSGIQIGSCTPVGFGYEDLAFDGQFLYGAKQGQIDKICLDIDGRSTCTVPEPATFALFGLGLLGLGISRRKQGGRLG